MTRHHRSIVTLAMALLLPLLIQQIKAFNDDNVEPKINEIVLAKCCELDEVLLDHSCVSLTEANETQPWRPTFESEDNYPGSKFTVAQPNYVLKFGPPRCRGTENQWDVYHYPTSTDTLAILTTGKLRHSVPDQVDEIEKAKELYGTEFLDVDDNVQAKAIHYDYPFGHYCVDKAVLTKDNLVTVYAKICVPRPSKWTSTDNLIRKAVDPAVHAIAAVCYLVVAVVYFVLPQLRDLVGNIITSMMLCLIVNRCASFVTIFTEFGNHINFVATGLFVCFFFLSSFILK